MTRGPGEAEMSVSEDISKIPPGVIAAAVVGVALLALSQNKGSSDNGGYGLVRAYEPTPMDPGIVSISLAEIDAKRQAVSDALAVGAASDISRVESGRDLGLASIGATRDTYLGRIAGDVAEGQTSAAREIGLSDIAANLQLGLEDVRARSSLGLATIASGERVAFGGYDVTNRQTAAGERVATQQIGVAQQLGTQALGNEAANNAAQNQTAQYSATTQRQATPGTKERIFGKLIDPIVGLVKFFFR